MEHTKGKWEIQEYSGLFAIGTHDDSICKLWELEEETHNRLAFENAQANARLIAAAPETKQQRDDLLAACKKLYQAMIDYEIDVNDIDTNPPYEHRAMMEEAKQAIAKAENILI